MFFKPCFEPGVRLALGDRPVISILPGGEQLPIVIYRNIQRATHEGVRHA